MTNKFQSDAPFSFDPEQTSEMLDWTAARIAGGPDPRHGALPLSELDALIGSSITSTGIGAQTAMALFTDTIVPSCRPFGDPTSLSFVASAPSKASLSFDAALGAASIFAGNWDGGSGAIHAENQALRWISDLAGWPENAGGVFVAGGTLGNLSALHAARDWHRRTTGARGRGAILCSAEAHSSIATAARVMDADLITAPADARGRLSAKAAAPHLTEATFAIVANGGATNCGAVDDIAGLTVLAETHNKWVHVDGAYGGAALADPIMAREFAGIERAHSLILDPHKWLFAPYDSSALIYRNAGDGAAAHGQRAVYLDTVDADQWNPSDYALHLSRRARGLPLWYSLATHGTAAYVAAVASTRKIAEEIAKGIAVAEHLDLLLGPQLTVILFKPRSMDEPTMVRWAEDKRRSGSLLCLPTRWRGEMVFRLCIVNPQTDPTHVLHALEDLR
ncbi:MAG: aminotransferase class V-fold PLP-dependent enzyme [Marinovum sp.]|nr:aminotransferase class V-fold PLP-dependent enzyme [Marinovum sp.]